MTGIASCAMIVIESCGMIMIASLGMTGIAHTLCKVQVPYDILRGL
jgi:hypothetical protein